MVSFVRWCLGTENLVGVEVDVAGASCGSHWSVDVELDIELDREEK